MKRFQKSYSVSRSSARLVESEGRLCLRRFLGRPLGVALNFGKLHIGKPIPFADLLANMQSHCTGLSYSDAYYLANAWLANEFGVCHLSFRTGELHISFNQKTLNYVKTFQTVLARHAGAAA